MMTRLGNFFALISFKISMPLRPGRRISRITTSGFASEMDVVMASGAFDGLNEKLQTAEKGQSVIDQDRIPGSLVKSGAHRLAGFDPFADGVISASAKLLRQKKGIDFGIFDDQYMQWDANLSIFIGR